MGRSQPANLGRYRVIKELGRGAMGRVYLAHDPEIDREVAIKTLQIFSALPDRERTEARDRFLREARSAGKLLHPGIVTLFDVGEADGLPYLAMEYVDGPTLDAFCGTDSLLPLHEVTTFIAGVARALDYAHRAGIIHRDIKPANLIRVGEASVKIMDFGLARAAEGQPTRNGALPGTPSYMSPEQIRGEPIDGRSDLFSLGVVLFEMLTGEKPFPGDSISSIIYRIVNEEPRDPTALHGRVTPELEAVLSRALSKSADARYATGAELAAALEQAAGRLDAQAPEPGPATSGGSAAARSVAEPGSGQIELTAVTASRPRRGSPVPYVVAILTLVLLVAGGAYVYRDRLGWARPEAPPPPVTWETRVRTEPPGIEVRLDGTPLDPARQGLVRFGAGAPGTLTAQMECRTAEHRLQPADAGDEVLLVFDPLELSWPLDPGVQGASVKLNGADLGGAPVELTLELCQENRLRIEAPGHRPAELTVPAGATPLEARNLLTALEVQPLPRGRLLIPDSRINLVYYVDGRRLDSREKEIELLEGQHELRFRNATYWIDVRREVRVVGGETVTPDLGVPPLTTLVVQAFPANCKVHLRRPGGSWQYLDETPLRKRIAVGRYDVRVTFNPTGESKEQRVELVAGENPPVRIAFGGGR